MRVSTNAPPTSSNSSSNFEFQQMAAALEDKMTLTFRNEMTEMKNMMKAFVPTPVPIKAVEERCTTCGNNHSFNMCPMTRGGYEAPVYHDNFQQFQQTASVGICSQNGNSGYRPSNLANHTHPPGFPSNQGKPSNQGNIPHQMVPYQNPPQNSQIVLANQLDNFKKTTEGSMQAMRNHITNLKAEIRSEVQGKIFDPGITFHEKSFEKFDKSSKELAPSKALLTLDVFDPLHPPLMDFHHVTLKPFPSLGRLSPLRFSSPLLLSTIRNLVWGKSQAKGTL
ncbi:hypothetical protein Tco_1101553 [Tanacetum coccineum]